MTLVIECLPSKHERSPEFNPKYHQKPTKQNCFAELDMVAHSCLPTTWKLSQED
jgi:hypothetical protein